MFVILKLLPAAITIPGYEMNLRQCHDSCNHMETSFENSLIIHYIGGLYSGGLIFGGEAYIWNDVSVSTCGGLIHGGLIFGGGLIVGGL